MASIMASMKASHLSIFMIILLILAPLASANLCSDLEAQGLHVEKKFTPNYSRIVKDYWSGLCSDLRPQCIVAPANACEMSHVIKELHKTSTLFAVKSGGHSAIPGFASVNDGLLISTEKLTEVIYNPADKTAVIGPGLKWEDAQKRLNGTGRVLVGGRIGGVGVGGLILGGGMSFLSNQYGWAANNVVNYEVVLANSTIVNANSAENDDLFDALKGGGNSFGIVTSYKLQTHPQPHKVWGGKFIYTDVSKAPEIMKAIRDFAEDCTDEKASIIPTAQYTASLKSWIIFTFYDGPVPPEAVFANFTALNPRLATQTWNSYEELLRSNDVHILKDKRYTTAGETMPLPNATVSAQVMQKVHAHWWNVTTTVLNVTEMISSIAIQPLTRKFAQQAQKRGGDLYNFPTDQDYLLIDVNFSYHNSSNDKAIATANKQIIDGYKNMIDKFIDDYVLPDVYRPLFMSEADGPQDYWGRLDPDSTWYAREVRKKYDPDMFFQKRTSGGFKLG